MMGKRESWSVNGMVNGEKIHAIGLHPEGDKIRVATDRVLEVIEWK